MAQIKSFEDIQRKIKQLVYSSPTLELDFYPTFEVDRESWESIQKSVDELASQLVPKVPYEKTDSFLHFNYMGVKCIVKPIQQPYKNSEVVNLID